MAAVAGVRGPYPARSRLIFLNNILNAVWLDSENPELSGLSGSSLFLSPAALRH